MPHFLKIEKVEFSQILATNQLVNIKFKEASLPDLPNNWTDFGEIPVFPDGTFLQPLHITNGIEPGNSYTVRATPQGAVTGKDKIFTYAQTTVIPTTVCPTTVPPTVPPTTEPPTTVPPTVPPTTEPPTTVAPTTVPPTVPPTTVAPTTVPPTVPPTTEPPTTVPPTVPPTTEPPTTVPPTTVLSPTVSLGSPVCRVNNCNDNAACTVRYSINTTNAPVGSYLDIVQTSGDGSVSMIDNNPASGVFSRYEDNGLELATYFTLQLKDSGGVVIATYDSSLGHQSFWQYLALCSAEPTTTTPPTTQAPTTVPPTTEAPTTVAPTTVPPTTLAPTTVAPTTLPPTTVAPTTVPPTTLAPTTVAPTTEAPTTVAPTTTEPPTTAPPTTVEPTTTVAPTTVAPTTIPATTTLPPVPTVSLGAPVCRIGNCNDNAACTVRYAINTTNAPVGSYLAIVQTSGGGTVGMVDTNPASGVFSRSEATGLELGTFFTLQLKDSGGIVIATYDGSIGHESFWQYLATCPA